MKKLSKKATVIAAATSAAVLFTAAIISSANAQEDDDHEDVVEYEFAFEVDESEDAQAREARLEAEVADYCDGYDASYYCEDEISDAVNDELDDDPSGE